MSYLERRTPWVGAFWSCIFPGLGHVYAQQKLLGIILIGWSFAITINTHLGLMTVYTLTGEFSSIAKVVNYEWLVFFPSIYFFSIYDAYRSIINKNNLLKEEQVLYLKEKFKNNKLEIV